MIWVDSLMTFDFDDIEIGDEVIVRDKEVIHIMPPDMNDYHQYGMDDYCGMCGIVTDKGKDTGYGGFYLKLDISQGPNCCWSPWMVEKVNAEPEQQLDADMNMLFSMGGNNDLE